MIRPRLDDWWTRKRKTELGLRDGAFQAAGVSLDVVAAPMIASRDLTWYSCRSDADDAVFAIGLTAERVPESLRADHAGGGPLATSLPRGRRVREHVLTPAVLALLDAEDPAAAVARGPRLLGLTIRDDSTVAIAPVEDDLMRGLVSVVLRVHSYYLGRDIDWSGAADGLRVLLGEHGKLTLESSPTEALLRVFLGDGGAEVVVTCTGGLARMDDG